MVSESVVWEHKPGLAPYVWTYPLLGTRFDSSDGDKEDGMRYYVYTVRGARLHRNSVGIKSLGLAEAWAGLLDAEPWMIADSQGIEVAWSRDWPVGTGLVHHQCQDGMVEEIDGHGKVTIQHQRIW